MSKMPARIRRKIEAKRLAETESYESQVQALQDELTKLRVAEARKRRLSNAVAPLSDDGVAVVRGMLAGDPRLLLDDYLNEHGQEVADEQSTEIVNTLRNSVVY